MPGSQAVFVDFIEFNPLKSLRPHRGFKLEPHQPAVGGFLQLVLRPPIVANPVPFDNDGVYT
jgi:hypothetical protein